MDAELVLRAGAAGVGIACLAVALGAVGSFRRRGAPDVGLAGRFALLAVEGLVPLAARSHLLRREAAAATAWRRLLVAGPASRLAALVEASVIQRVARRGGGSAPPHDEAFVETMAGWRAACVVGGTAMTAPIALLAGPVLGGVGVALTLAASRAPDALLAAEARRATGGVEASMPAALELLAACCRGGLALEAALAVAASHAPEPLRSVLDRARRRQRAGQSPSAALRLEAEATGLDEVAAIGRLIERHHQLGLPLEAPFLARAQAAAARARVGALARAGRAVPLASLLVAAVIAPCCVGVLATWVVVALVGQTGFA